MILKKRATFILITLRVFTSLMFSSCKKETAEPIDMGYGYFQTGLGSWVVYDVDSIVHSAFYLQTDTYIYQIKEVIDTVVFLDEEDRPSQRIERFIKKHDTLNWVIKDVWFSTLTTRTAEKVEENNRYIKLVFPINEGETWNGNAYNTIDEWEYEYTTVDAAETVNTLLFDSVLTVLQIDEVTLINSEYAEEKYAKGVGMIYKRYIFTDSQGIQDEIDFTMRINSYGSN